MDPGDLIAYWTHGNGLTALYDHITVKKDGTAFLGQKVTLRAQFGVLISRLEKTTIRSGLVYVLTPSTMGWDTELGWDVSHAVAR